ncbi:MAG TPA: chemotaxis protein CheX [Polyangiaceae bacterium]|nr:chemotaxis protein CheX [Polyangiaceae bacterium]
MMTPSPELLADTAAPILAECAFLCTTPARGKQDWATSVSIASLRFSGPRSGRIEVCAAFDLLKSLAADMLGIDPSDSDASRHADAALAEITNVVTGRLVANLFGTSSTWQLSLPEVSHGPVPPLGERAISQTLVDPDLRPIRVTLYLGKAA